MGLTSDVSGFSLLTELDAFYSDHRQCGELDAGVAGPVVWFDCACGARMARQPDDDDRARQLPRRARGSARR